MTLYLQHYMKFVLPCESLSATIPPSTVFLAAYDRLCIPAKMGLRLSRARRCNSFRSNDLGVFRPCAQAEVWETVITQYHSGFTAQQYRKINCTSTGAQHTFRKRLRFQTSEVADTRGFHARFIYGNRSLSSGFGLFNCGLSLC